MSQIRLYVGSYTFPGKAGNTSKGIYCFDFAPEDGKLTLLQTVSDTPNPSYVSVCGKKLCLYAASEGRDSFVASYKIDPSTGCLTTLNQTACEGTAMCHVVPTADGKAVYTAQYGTGHVSAVEILNDGSLGKVLSSYAHQGKGINPQRQEHQHAHSVTISPDGKYAYACDLGMDKIMIYAIGEDGSLTPNSVPFKTVAPGEGPRHMEFAPNGRDLYLVTEMGAKVIGYRYHSEDGSLEAFQTINTLPDGYDKPNTAADVHVSADGKFLYMSNRGIDELVYFSIAEDGTLTRLGSFNSVGGFPRSFALSPDGGYIAVANQNGYLDIFTRNQEDGSCAHLSQFAIPMCVCVKFFTL